LKLSLYIAKICGQKVSGKIVVFYHRCCFDGSLLIRSKTGFRIDYRWAEIVATLEFWPPQQNIKSCHFVLQ